ncbi:hypothetical protein TNIN_301011 [Trichonephila inaurata madagascariensis]|uniref:Uncharacterized protein n=1 Tax=Trichonephila inaurata madagascariensis TaxID=2747483 RepID=A0A8X6K0C3_9ARAC|nr:hypothetical protein TNIN_301011 [Trichonephila inaurata madagascariensis]
MRCHLRYQTRRITKIRRHSFHSVALPHRREVSTEILPSPQDEDKVIDIGQVMYDLVPHSILTPSTSHMRSLGRIDFKVIALERFSVESGLE